MLKSHPPESPEIPFESQASLANFQKVTPSVYVRIRIRREGVSDGDPDTTLRPRRTNEPQVIHQEGDRSEAFKEDGIFSRGHSSHTETLTAPVPVILK